MIIQNLRVAWRSLRRTPVFTVVAVLTLALGIGANSAIFSIANSILWRPLAVDDPDRLLLIMKQNRAQGEFFDYSYADYEDFRRESGVFEDVIAYYPAALSFLHQQQSERIWAELVSPNFFSMLGVRLPQGRGFLDPDPAGGEEAPTVVVSDRFRRRLEQDGRPALGRRLHLNGHDFTVVGVAPPEFHGAYLVLFAADVWVSTSDYSMVFPGAPGGLHQRGGNNFRLMGRLRAGTTADQARAAVAAIGRRMASDFPATAGGFEARAIPEIEARPEPDDAGGATAAALAFLAVVGLVLLIACANVANLLLVRAAARRKEIALRLALGASRRHLLSQLLTESVLLGLLGGGAGLTLAIWATSALGNGIRFPTDIPLVLDFHPDPRVLVFTLGVSLLTGVVFGLAPALQAARPDLVAALKNDPQPGGRRRWLDLRAGLVVGQVAVSCLLLVGTGLMVGVLKDLKAVNPGFDSRGGLLVSLSPNLAGLGQKEGDDFYRRVLEQLSRTPGVRGATLAQFPPLEFSSDGGNVFVSGHESSTGREDGDPVGYSIVGDGYLGVMGTPLLEGRDFTARDDSAAPRIAIVNQTMAQAYWPGVTAIGKTFRLGGADRPALEVVGVVANGIYRNPGERPAPYFFLPLSQHYAGDVTLIVRSAGDPMAQLGTVRRVVGAANPEVPVFDAKSIDQLIQGRALLAPRLAAGLAALSGALALGLAMVGLYGVISYSVSQRTREMGIRIALGAPAGAVRGLVLGDGFRLAAIGVTLGALGGVALDRVFRNLFYGVDPRDPALLLAVPVLLIGIAMLASYLPARRATRVDPMRALRAE